MQPATKQPQRHFVHGMVRGTLLNSSTNRTKPMIGQGPPPSTLAHSRCLPKRNPGVTPPRKPKRPASLRALFSLVPVRGVEPPTFALRMRCSTY